MQRNTASTNRMQEQIVLKVFEVGNMSHRTRMKSNEKPFNILMLKSYKKPFDILMCSSVKH